MHFFILNDEFYRAIYLGYDTGVISGALVTIGSDLGPNELSNLQKVFKPQVVASSNLSSGTHHLCHHPRCSLRGSDSWHTQ